jgi:hypothetical protein
MSFQELKVMEKVVLLWLKLMKNWLDRICCRHSKIRSQRFLITTCKRCLTTNLRYSKKMKNTIM